MRISSTRNPAVAFLRALAAPGARREHGVFLAEGVRLVSEALATGQESTIALYDPDALSRSAPGSFLLDRLPEWAEKAYEADARVLRAAAQTETPSGVLVALRFPQPGPFASQRQARFGLVLDGLSDPGNAGTIVRTAAAAGVDYVAAMPGTVDLFGPKVVRAGMGAHFRLPIYTHLSPPELADTIDEGGLVATRSEMGESIYAFAWPEQVALVIGSEAHGLGAETENLAVRAVHIPMRDGVESLNAAVAASVIMYHVLGPSVLQA